MSQNKKSANKSPPKRPVKGPTPANSRSGSARTQSNASRKTPGSAVDEKTAARTPASKNLEYIWTWNKVKEQAEAYQQTTVRYSVSIHPNAVVKLVHLKSDFEALCSAFQQTGTYKACKLTDFDVLPVLLHFIFALEKQIRQSSVSHGWGKLQGICNSTFATKYDIFLYPAALGANLDQLEASLQRIYKQYPDGSKPTLINRKLTNCLPAVIHLLNALRNIPSKDTADVQQKGRVTQNKRDHQEELSVAQECSGIRDEAACLPQHVGSAISQENL